MLPTKAKPSRRLLTLICKRFLPTGRLYQWQKRLFQVIRTILSGRIEDFIGMETRPRRTPRWKAKEWMIMILSLCQWKLERLKSASNKCDKNVARTQREQSKWLCISFRQVTRVGKPGEVHSQASPRQNALCIPLKTHIRHLGLPSSHHWGQDDHQAPCHTIDKQHRRPLLQKCHRVSWHPQGFQIYQVPQVIETWHC